MLRSLAHGLRLGAAGLVAGVVGGVVAGLGARLVMYVIRLMNPSFNGAVTHANSENGRFTAEGTLAVVAEAAFLAVPGAFAYLAVRRWMPGGRLVKGLVFGLLILVVGGPAVIDGSYEYFRFVSPWVAVLLFALLFPLYGIVVAPLTETLGGGRPGRPANRAVRVAGYAVLAVVVARSVVADVAVLRYDFQFFR